MNKAWRLGNALTVTGTLMMGAGGISGIQIGVHPIESVTILLGFFAGITGAFLVAYNKPENQK